MSSRTRYPVPPEEILNPEPLDVLHLKSGLGLTIEEFAAATGRSPRSAARWLAEDGASPAGGSAARTIRRLAYLDSLLADVVGREQSLGWLRTPNRGFRGEAPLDLVTTDRLEDVISVLEVLADGTPA